jgi:hypothetical protein
MFVGMLYMPESPRFLMHKKQTLESYKVWKRIRGMTDLESRQEFYLMKIGTEHEAAEVAAGTGSRRFPWLDFITERESLLDRKDLEMCVLIDRQLALVAPSSTPTS